MLDLLALVIVIALLVSVRVCFDAARKKLFWRRDLADELYGYSRVTLKIGDRVIDADACVLKSIDVVHEWHRGFSVKRYTIEAMEFERHDAP